MEITAKNYRCYSSSKPLKIEVRDGIVAIVGPNNSGKSAVLKFFFELRPLFQKLGVVSNVMGHQEISVDFAGVKHQIEPLYKFNEESMEVEFKGDDWRFKIVRSRVTREWRTSEFVIRELDLRKTLPPGMRVDRSDATLWFYENGNRVSSFNIKTKIIDPILEISQSVYFPSFRNTINVGGNADFYDIKIGEDFIRAWHDFENSDNPNTREKSIQVVKDLKEIFGYDTLDIKSSIQSKEIIVNINEKSYLLSELGSGIAQFILVLINAALKNPYFILIDEPELNLHPKLQIDFVNRLLKYSKKGMIIATHSLGLAHSVAQQIYLTNQKKGETESVIKPFEKTPSFVELLGELNFSGFPELGYKKVLLVEGPTDVTFFSTLLRRLGKYQDFLIWNLGGSSMINSDTATQLSELSRLGRGVKVYCWIDSEKKSSNEKISSARQGFIKNAEKLGIDVIASERRSIENYFPHSITSSINPKMTSMGHYDELPAHWDKGSNWRVAHKVNIAELEQTDLHEFLKRI